MMNELGPLLLSLWTPLSLFDLWLSTDGAEVLWEISTMYKTVEK